MTSSVVTPLHLAAQIWVCITVQNTVHTVVFLVKDRGWFSAMSNYESEQIRSTSCRDGAADAAHPGCVVGVQEGFYVYTQGDCVPKDVTRVHVHDAVRRLPPRAFQSYHCLREVVLPLGLLEMGTGMFQSCTALEQLHVPSTLFWIGAYAFYYCKSLRSVKLEEGLQAVGAYAFASTAITHIALPSSATHVGEHAFSYCRSLTDLHLRPCTIAVVKDCCITHHFEAPGEPPADLATVHLRGGPV